MFAAFGAHFMEASAFRGMMSEFLTFVALDQLELGIIFLWEESLVINVESMFDALVGQLWVVEEYHERVMLCIILELSS